MWSGVHQEHGHHNQTHSHDDVIPPCALTAMPQGAGITWVPSHLLLVAMPLQEQHKMLPMCVCTGKSTALCIGNLTWWTPDEDNWIRSFFGNKSYFGDKTFCVLGRWSVKGVCPFWCWICCLHNQDPAATRWVNSSWINLKCSPGKLQSGQMAGEGQAAPVQGSSAAAFPRGGRGQGQFRSCSQWWHIFWASRTKKATVPFSS